MIRKEQYPIIGMHCASCKQLIEKMVGKIDGVRFVSVNYATEIMSIEYLEEQVTIAEIRSAVSKAGSYKLITTDSGDTILTSPNGVKNLIEEGNDNDRAGILKKKEYSKLKRKLIIVGIASLPFLLLMVLMLLAGGGVIPMFEHSFGSILIEELNYRINLLHLLQFVFATPILFWGGSQFFSSAFSAVKVKSANMDTLIVLGTTTAWIFSTLVTFYPSLFHSLSIEVFFEATVFIIFFILLGRFLEVRAKGQANDAIQKLLELQAKDANVIRDGVEVNIPLNQVVIGDMIIVRPGEKVPVDGTIRTGSSTLDESMVTGESLPISKSIDDNVIGSTINKTSTFQFEVEKIGRDTMLSQIIQMVEEAQGTTAPIQKLADQVSSRFVPVVILISILALLFWSMIAPQFGLIPEGSSVMQLAVYIATTILIIACPCALGLATPTAVMVGTGKAARQGILIKDAQALELAHKITSIVFDKTGTLTNGLPEVNRFEILGKSNVDELLRLAYLVENLSEHPLSNSIASYAVDVLKETPSGEVVDFLPIEGRGVSGTVDGKSILLGNNRLMVENNLKVNKDISRQIETLHEEGSTVIYMSVDSEVVGVFAIADSIKADSKIAVDQLHSLGIRVIMLTGDNEKTAMHIASQLGIDEVIAGVLPGEKATKIKSLQEESIDGIVAMVGDGVNDAPALAQADIGIAMGAGTDIAIEAGDIVIVKGTLDKVVETIQLSKLTLSVIKQNLVWAFGYNIIAIPVSAGVLFPSIGLLLSPIIASAAMAFSSISVVLNSVRLKSMSMDNKKFSDILFYLILVIVIGVITILSLGSRGSNIDQSTNSPQNDFHIHAGFRIYKDNQLQDYSAPQFMHISPCDEGHDGEEEELPDIKEQVHLHDGFGDVVHVHKDGITWEDLLTSLGVYDDLNSNGGLEIISSTGKKITIDTQIGEYESVIILSGEATGNYSDFIEKDRMEEAEALIESC